jgi:hypothetical protein
MFAIHHFLKTTSIFAGAIVIGLWPVAPAQAQFGRVYTRYSMYGSGPYGYGTTGYYKAVTPESPSYKNPRVLESDYGYDPPRVYEGKLPTERKVERPSETWRHIPWYDSRIGPDYHYFGGGIYGPYGPADYDVNPPKNVFRSLGDSR